ncbi:MAG: hypothetical protein AVO39_05370 [delta proteobacterium MLS_D]|jgi:energy-coupling factor transporter ATP-binding protein EcfA2|nr:MAG: hypothetical protein AVO39_05370 [delta proteobacterium MLS_D]
MNDSGPTAPELSWLSIRPSGLAVAAEDMRETAESLRIEQEIFIYKKKADCLWIALLGGTGTGKSTIFNALAGKDISTVGVARPTTTAPVAYGHRDHAAAVNSPFFLSRTKRAFHDATGGGSVTGNDGNPFIRYVEHGEDHLSHLVLLDTPDLDSLESQNRCQARLMYHLSHGVIFVTSQEKYADQVLFRFMHRASVEGKPLFVVFNKAEKDQTAAELVRIFRERGISLNEERFFVIPFMGADERDSGTLRRILDNFALKMQEVFSRAEKETIIREDRQRIQRNIADKASRLLNLIEREKEAEGRWVEKLDSLVDSSARFLLEEMKTRNEQRNLHAIKREIKKIFGAYDVLAKPRGYIASLVRAPLDLLRIGRAETDEEKKESLLRAGRRIDNSPIISAIEHLNVLILENLSPSSPDAPLFADLRKGETAMKEREIESRLSDVQAEIAVWLENTISELERDLPKGKKVGIYSTSVLWGAAILSFETVLGGGITLLEMAFNTVLAPFVTKSSADLFAHRELRAIIRKMNDRYREGILSIFEEQRDRYTSIIANFALPENATDELARLKREMEAST